MAHSVESKSKNAANALRDALEKAERMVVQVSGNNVEAFLLLLDQIEQSFEELKATEIDLRSEEVRWHSLLSRLESKPEPLTAAAAKAGGLARLRAQHPPAESFWWHLDAEVRRRRLATARRLIVTLVTLVVVFGGGYWVINQIFPPDPTAVRMMGVTSDIERFAAEGRWEDALAVIKQAQTELPDEVELYLWEVVLANQLDRQAEADAAMARAQALVPNQLPEMWVQLGNLYLQVGDLAGAAEAGQAASALAPDNPQVTFLLAGVAEAQNDLPTAINLFERTFELAEDENPQLAVIARVRMGNLLQRAPSMFAEEPVTDTATVTGTNVVTEPVAP
ncbi:MAG: hypothetical protein R2932_01955 [Caldilineaceae bacterium]